MAERDWKPSPDWSGYAILQRRFCGKAIAFERKAGLNVIASLSVPLQKNQLIKNEGMGN